MLYILSPGHSGSTLLTLMLGTHPDVATIGERHYLISRIQSPTLPRNLCLCGLPTPECDFLVRASRAGIRKLAWYQKNANYTEFQYHRNKPIKRRLGRLAERFDFGRRPGLASRILSAPYRNVLQANAALIDHLLQEEGKSVFLDSSKSTVDFRLMEKSGLFDMVPIWLSRDGRGQYHSLMRRRPHFTEEEVAQSFVGWFERITKQLDQWEGPIVRIRYEDLCASPESELRRIAAECGLDPDGVSTDFRTGATHAIGNGAVVRDRTGEVKLQERWRTELTDDQLETFEKVAGDANRALGYTD